MRLLVLTQEIFFREEATELHTLFSEGLETLHLRKPAATEERLKRLLEQIHPSYLDRIVLHDHFDLARAYGLKGIHLNSRNPEIPEGYNGSVSRSCHTLEEVSRSAAFDYVFLSPIFQSISKKGYGCAFTKEELAYAGTGRILNERVIALGGIDRETLPQAASMGFGGVAVLGALWDRGKTSEERRSIFRDLQKRCNR